MIEASRSKSRSLKLMLLGWVLLIEVSFSESIALGGPSLVEVREEDKGEADFVKSCSVIVEASRVGVLVKVLRNKRVMEGGTGERCGMYMLIGVKGVRRAKKVREDRATRVNKGAINRCLGHGLLK